MNNYPIKYAVLKVEVSDKDIKRTLGYIVSKCYVVESFSRIDKEGNTRNGYKVVFPYNNINNYITSFIDNLKNIESFNILQLIKN